jgi:hypothetical protein
LLLDQQYRRDFHAQIFFTQLGDFGLSNAIKEIKSRIISKAGGIKASRETVFIFILVHPGKAALEKTPRNSGWGGSWDA